jgi:hypothetical protein
VPKSHFLGIVAVVTTWASHRGLRSKNENVNHITGERKGKHLRKTPQEKERCRRRRKRADLGQTSTGAIVGQGEKCHYSRTVRAAEASLQRDETGHSPNARMEVEGETDWALMETGILDVLFTRAGVLDLANSAQPRQGDICRSNHPSV